MQTLTMLSKTDDFSSVFDFKRRIYSGAYFSTHIRLYPITSSENLLVTHPIETEMMRVGFIVSKKISKRAVDRNYMRRVLREFCRNCSTLSRVDVVIRVQKKYAHAQFQEVKQEFLLLCKKIEQEQRKWESKQLAHSNV